MHSGGRDIREHHQSSGLLVGILLRPAPLSPDPLLAEEKLVVVIGDRRGGEGPRALETRAIRVAAAEGMSTGEGDDFLVVESVKLKKGQVALRLGQIKSYPIR